MIWGLMGRTEKNFKVLQKEPVLLTTEQSLNSSKYSLNILKFILCPCACIYVEVRHHHMESQCPPPLCGSQQSNSGGKAWQCVSLPEPFNWYLKQHFFLNLGTLYPWKVLWLPSLFPFWVLIMLGWQFLPQRCTMSGASTSILKTEELAPKCQRLVDSLSAITRCLSWWVPHFLTLTQATAVIL